MMTNTVILLGVIFICSLLAKLIEMERHGLVSKVLRNASLRHGAYGTGQDQLDHYIIFYETEDYQ